MATNSYFRNFDAKNDQELLHSIVTESIKVTGYDVNYIPRTLVNEDTILGEDSISEYKDAYSVEMFIKSVDGFEGEGDLVSKFGLEVRDQIIFSLARRAWEGLDIGCDLRSPVSKAYKSPFAFSGKLENIIYNIK